jgi:hypothetical protein
MNNDDTTNKPVAPMAGTPPITSSEEPVGVEPLQPSTPMVGTADPTMPAGANTAPLMPGNMPPTNMVVEETTTKTEEVVPEQPVTMPTDTTGGIK